MKEFIDKLIERLEETDLNDIQMVVREVLKKYGFPYESIVQDEVWDALDELSTNKFAIGIVNQLAEEYKVSEIPTSWIPCSERLPIQNEKVLCTYIFNNNHDRKYVQVLDCYATDKKPHFQHEGYEGLEVIAWMPLPAPFEQKEKQ